MSRAVDYRNRAEECIQLARTARTPQQHTMLMHIAETWVRLADDWAKLQSEEELTERLARDKPKGAQMLPLRS